MDLHPDFKELLAECVAARVEFAIVGGYAVGNKRASGRRQDLADLEVLELSQPRGREALRGVVFANTLVVPGD